MLDLEGPWISYSGLANVPQLLPPMLRADIINQSRHLSDTPANLNLSWNFLAIHKPAAGTGSDLLLLTQQAGPILLIRVQLWASGHMGCRLASALRTECLGRDGGPRGGWYDWTESRECHSRICAEFRNIGRCCRTRVGVMCLVAWLWAVSIISHIISVLLCVYSCIHSWVHSHNHLCIRSWVHTHPSMLIQQKLCRDYCDGPGSPLPGHI